MAGPVYTNHVHLDYQHYLTLLREEFLVRYGSRRSAEKCLDDYDLIKAVGTGSYGEVYLARDKCTLDYHAVKVVEKRIVVERRHVIHLLREKRILNSIDFPFVLTLDAYFKDNVYLYLVFPYQNGGELFTYIQTYGGFSEDVAKFYAAQMVLALEYLHHCQIIHRDLKPENILLQSTGYIKLCDFGFSKYLKKKTFTLCGTPEYLAPELILCRGYSFPVDWWSLGVLVFEMIAGHAPFFSSEPTKLYTKILEAAIKYPECIQGDCKKFIKGLLQVDPTKRLGGLKNGTFDIKSHVWFSDIYWQLLLHQKVDVPFSPVCKSPGDTSNFPDIEQHKLKKEEVCLYEQDFLDF